MGQMRISRRTAFAAAAGGAAALNEVVLGLQRHWETDPSSVFCRMRECRDATSVASAFAAANTPSLMAIYGCFFQEFLNKHGTGALALIQRAAEEQRPNYPHNRHRLDALPAVCAAHLLIPTRDSDGPLTDVIRSTLDDPRREVLQIVLENLVSAAMPGVDTGMVMSTNPEILRSIQKVICRAEQDLMLISPASIAVQYLLNARAIDQQTGKDVRSYDVILAEVKDSKAPDFWYLHRLIDLHRTTFVADAKDLWSLPPQYEEALIGWEAFSKWSQYLAHLGLIKCRQSYLDVDTALGIRPAGEAMTVDEAGYVQRKSLSLVRHFNLVSLLNHGPDPQSLRIAPRFKLFLRDLKEEAKKKQPFGVTIEHPTQLEVTLKRAVPFAQFRYNNAVANAPLSGLEWARFGYLTVIIGHSVYQAVDALLHRLGCRERQTKLRESTHEKYQMALQDAYSEAYVGVDEQQRKLGDLPVWTQITIGPGSH